MKSNAPDRRPMLFVGIDWADRQHVAWHFTSEGVAAKRSQSVDQQPEAIVAWIESLRKLFPEHRIMIALEQSRGALFVGLSGFDDLELYPINPKQLARYRESMYPSGGKSDPADARLLAEFLAHARDRLRPWRPDDPQTRRIAELAELRRKMVDSRKSLVLQLNSCLKLFFPQAISLTSRSLHDNLMLDLIRRWPTLQQLKRPHPKTLRSFLAEHGIRNEERQTKIIQAVRDARPLTDDKALFEPQAQYAQALVEQIRALNQGIAGFDQELQKQVDRHADQKLFRVLPGAGDVMVPRLIAAMGSERDRYDSALNVQCYTGVAPITSRSGNSIHVDRRRGCPTFLRQTFHEFADHARKWSDWSRAYYKMKIHQGMKHHAAVRSLAYKWIRIIFRLWKDRTIYSEEAHIARLKQTGSPVVKFLET